MNMMISRSALLLCKEHPECLQALEFLLNQQKDEWIPVKDLRESTGIELNVWKALIQKLGEYHGVGYLETYSCKNKKCQSKVRIKSGLRDRVQRFIEVARN